MRKLLLERFDVRIKSVSGRNGGEPRGLKRGIQIRKKIVSGITEVDEKSLI